MNGQCSTNDWSRVLKKEILAEDWKSHPAGEAYFMHHLDMLIKSTKINNPPPCSQTMRRMIRDIVLSDIDNFRREMKIGDYRDAAWHLTFIEICEAAAEEIFNHDARWMPEFPEI